MPNLDRLILKSFFGPFFLTFLMAWFVLLMQFLWFFLEKIAGKGLEFGLILELLAYRSVGLLPLALPLAVLVASVMVVGGMAEHYEWSAFQSAGVGPGRMLRSLACTGLLVAGGSYLAADYLIPAANGQFLTRLTAVQQKKPSLSLETGVFNDDLDQYVFYAAGRSPDGQTLHDILLYDESTQTERLNQVAARTGTFQIASQEDKRLLLQLRDGEHFQETTADDGSTQLVRTAFTTHTLSFDLTQFDLRQDSTFLQRNHQALLPTWALQQAADSLAQLPPTSDRLTTTRARQRQRLLFEKHRKLGLAAVCLPFILLGGTVGTVVRKGGFGYPLMISIVAFVGYVLLLEAGHELVKSGTLSGLTAGWMPVAAVVVITAALGRNARRR